MHSINLELFADYFQFYIQDDDESVGDISDVWTEEAVVKKLAITDKVVGVGTARNMDVSVTIFIQDSIQAMDKADFNLINESTIVCETGTLVVAGCSDYFPDARRIEVSPGKYNIQVGYKNLTDIFEDGLVGNDSYYLWLSPCT